MKLPIFSFLLVLMATLVSGSEDDDSSFGKIVAGAVVGAAAVAAAPVVIGAAVGIGAAGPIAGGAFAAA